MRDVSFSVPILVSCGLVAAVLGGCATTPEVEKSNSPAQYLFQSGMARMEAGDYRGAVDAFNKLRNNYPYSRYAVRADLRLGDAHFEQDEYASAVSQYRNFVKLHPKHPKVPYARFRVGLARYRQMPSDWFFLPPPHERNLAATRQAVRALNKFLRKHPESEYADEGRRFYRQARRRLADHEMYVAEFYLDRGNASGARYRLETLLEKYSGLGLDAKALFLLARSHAELDEVEEAKTAIRDLLKHHPETDYARRARELADTYGLDVSTSSG